MKGLLKFLLNTGVGREIVRAIIGLAIRLFKKKVLDRVEPYKRENIETILELADMEIHADIDSGRVDVKRML